MQHDYCISPFPPHRQGEITRIRGCSANQREEVGERHNEGNKRGNTTRPTATTTEANPPRTQPQETTRRERSKTVNDLENPPLSGHQVFVRIPDTWSEEGKKPAYIQAMPIPKSLDALKEGLGQPLSIPTHAFRIRYGGKTLTNHSSLEAQGVRKDTTVWMMVGGLFGGADMEMGDAPQLVSSAVTTIHRLTQTHSQETQSSIDEWIDRLRISNPLTQDLASVNMLMTALNLTKDQATTAITEALNEGDEDEDTNISRFQQVQSAFPDNFEQFLETNDIAFPIQHEDWEAFSNSFKEHLAGTARHVEFKINPAWKHRLGHNTSGQPRDPSKGRLMHNETVTLSHLNVLSARPLIQALSEFCFQPGTTGHWHRDITFQPPGQPDPRMGTGSDTISILRTEASDKTLYELYVTRTKSLQIQGQDSQPTWHLHRSDALAEIEVDSIVLEPSTQEAKRGFQFAIAMHRAGGVAETDILDNIMFHLAAAGLWQIAELHTLAKDTCMANLLIDKGQGRAGFLRTGVHCGGEKRQQGILSKLMLNHENSTFSMDLMSTRNRLMPSTEDPGPQKAGLPITLSLRVLQQSTHREKLSVADVTTVAAVTVRIHYSKMVSMLRADTPDIGDGHAATEAKLLRRFCQLVSYCLGPRLPPYLLQSVLDSMDVEITLLKGTINWTQSKIILLFNRQMKPGGSTHTDLFQLEQVTSWAL